MRENIVMDSALAQAIVGNKYLINLNNLYCRPARTGIQRVCYEFISRWPHIDNTVAFIECGSDKIGLLEPEFFDVVRQYFEEEDQVLVALGRSGVVTLPEVSPGWLGILSARNRIVCMLSVADALKYCRAVISLEESLNLNFYSLAAKTQPEKIFNLCHDFLVWTHPELFHINWQDADNISLSLSNRRLYPNNFFTATATREIYINSINPGDSRQYAVIPPGADGVGRSIRRSVPESNEFVVVGTLEPRKQPLRILDAFLEINANEVRAKLCFAGRMGWLKKEDEERLRGALASNPWLRWVDSPTDKELMEIVAHARATIYFSLAEGFGSPPVESLALGVPCIVSGLIPSVLDMAPNGQLRVDPENTNALVDAVERLLDDDVLKKLQHEIETLKLPTWKGFVDGIQSLIETHSNPGNCSDGNLPSYRVIVDEIYVLMRIWELDRTNLIRSLLRATGISWTEREIEALADAGRRLGWSNVDAVLAIMNALPRGHLPASLVSAAIDKRLHEMIHTVPPKFAAEWRKRIRALLAISTDQDFEIAIYRDLLCREPGASELTRAQRLGTGELSRLQCLQEGLLSEEYRNRRIESARLAWKHVGNRVEPQDLLLKSLEWEERLLGEFWAQSAVDRCMRLESLEIFLQVAYRDLARTDPPENKRATVGGMSSTAEHRVWLLLEILLSQPCLRAVTNPAIHLQLIHKLATRIGIIRRIASEPLSLVSITSDLMTVPEDAWPDRAISMIIPEESRAHPQAVELVGAVLASRGDQQTVIAVLVYHAFLYGMVDAEKNSILEWSVAHLLSSPAIPETSQTVAVVKAASVNIRTTFKSVIGRLPTTGELDILERVQASIQDDHDILVALWLFRYRNSAKKEEDDILQLFSILLSQFATLRARLGDICEFHAELEEMSAEQTTLEVRHIATPASIQLIPPPSTIHQVVDSSAQSPQPIPIRSVDALLAYDDEFFIQHCYQTLLKRDADPAGMAYYLDRLKSGYTKRSIVFDIATSKEAKEIGQSLVGLDTLINEQSMFRHWGWNFLLKLLGMYSLYRIKPHETKNI